MKHPIIIPNIIEITDEEIALMIEHCYNEADDRFCEICPLRKECSEA